MANVAAWALGKLIVFVGMDQLPWMRGSLLLILGVYIVSGIAGLAVGAVRGRWLVSGIPATVELAEPLGNEILLHVRTAGVELTARLPAGVPPASGSPVHLAADPDRVHFFDPASGLAISR